MIGERTRFCKEERDPAAIVMGGGLWQTRRTMKKISSAFQSPHIRPFLFSMFIFGAATGVYGGGLNNFLAEVLSITRFERGIVEFLRELPGLALIFILALLYRHSETKIIRLALIIGGVGLAGMAVTGGSVRWVPILFIVIWSTGEHLVMPARQATAIHSAKPGREGMAMGLTRSAGNIGQVLGFYSVSLVFLLLSRYFPGVGETDRFRLIFGLGAVFVILGLVSTSRLETSGGHVRRDRFFLSRRYLRYYVLEAFFGARKQVFLTFAPYVLILKYGASTGLIATLYGIYSLLNIFMNPVFGKLIDRFGHRLVLVADSALLIVLCFFYGFSHHFLPLEGAYALICVIFVVDAMLFGVGTARSVYAKTIASTQKELTSTLSTGISINHLISVLIAMGGGLLWETLGIEVLFGLAGVFGLGSLVFSYRLPKPDRVEQL